MQTNVPSKAQQRLGMFWDSMVLPCSQSCRKGHGDLHVRADALQTLVGTEADQRHAHAGACGLGPCKGLHPNSMVYGPLRETKRPTQPARMHDQSMLSSHTQLVQGGLEKERCWMDMLGRLALAVHVKRQAQLYSPDTGGAPEAEHCSI